MLIPYNVDVPMERLPFTNWFLVAVTFFISLAILLGAGRERKKVVNPAQLQRLREDAKKENPDPEKMEELERLEEEEEEAKKLPLALRPKHFEWEQLFTYVFVHGHLFHLLGNLVFLFVFGNAVNAKLGHIGFLVSYFLLGALAGLGWLVLGNGLPLVGASGAIMGLLGIFLVLFPRNEVSVGYLWMYGRGGSFNVASGYLIAFYLIGDLVGTLTKGGGGGVAYVVHLIGSFIGIGLAIGLILLKWIESTEYEENLLQVFGWQQQPQRYPELVPDRFPPKTKKKKSRKRHFPENYPE